MHLNVFIFGRPGSGKSSVAQLIQRITRENSWDTEYIYDYKLLQELFEQENEEDIPISERRFHHIKDNNEINGFDVKDFQVLDEVLNSIVVQMMRMKEMNDVADPEGNKLQLVEFARNKYEDSLRKFGSELLQDSCIIYIQTDIEKCIRRIHRRVGDGFESSHYVSDAIMRSYYSKDDWLDESFNRYINSLASNGIRIYLKEIDNDASIEDLADNIREFVRLYLVRETEALPIVINSVEQTEPAD